RLAMQFALDKEKQVLSIAGSFSLQAGIPPEDLFLRDLQKIEIPSDRNSMRVDLQQLEGDREGMLIACQRVRDYMSEKNIRLHWENVPESIHSLWLLVTEKSP